MMQFCAVLGFLLAICLPINAEPVGSSPEENKAQYPAVAANFNMGKPVREGALLQLADFVKHGDTLLKERLQASYTDLKEQLKQGDSLLKNRMTEGVDQLKEERKEGDDRLKEERKEGDDRLKEELDEDVAWLKGRVQEGQDRMKEDLEEAKKTFTGEMSDLKDAFDKLQDSVKSSNAVTDTLKQQVDDVQAELGRTRHLLQTTQTELDNTKEKMGTLETELGATKELLGTTKELLDNTTQKAESTEQELHRARQELQTAQAEVDSLKAEAKRLQPQEETGSTFTRWGRKTCPDNTSTVYSGVAGGSHYSQPGGASNYLCLVRDPQLDNKTAVPVNYNYLYGAEYQDIQGHHQQDVVCSVCRAPQATTIMVPATLTCPDGWTPQYKGHLVSGHDGHKGRFEYVCVDEERENSEHYLGHYDYNGALFYHVVTRCGSLPCPPYVNSTVVTCVVCSQ